MDDQANRVDSAPRAEVRAALVKWMTAKGGERTQVGIDMMWKLYKAPAHTLSYEELDAGSDTIDLHFGWLCTHVARELGDPEPKAFALTNVWSNDQGQKMLTLKPTIVDLLANPKG